MRPIIQVMIHELNRQFRRKGFLFGAFGIPILLAAASFLWQGLTPTAEDIVVATQTLAERFDGITMAGVVDQTGRFSTNTSDQIILYPDEATAQIALDAEEIDAIYVLPPDYLETGMARQIIPSMALEDVTLAPLFSLLFDAVGGSGSDEVLARIQQPTTVTQVNLSPEVRANLTRDEDTNFALVGVTALLFIVTILNSSTYLMQSVIEEKENRMIEVLITTMRPSQLLIGKILAMAVLALTQIAIWVLMGVVLFQFQADFFKQAAPFILSMLNIPVEPIPWIALFYLLGFFMYAAVFGAIGALSNSMQEGPQLSILMILPTMIPLWAASALVADPNGTLAVVLSLIPFTAPLTLTIRLVLTSVPLEQLLLSAGIMIVTLVALYWMAGRLFRVQTLLSGKAPKIRELPRLLFGRG